MGALVLTLAYTGLRWGEAVGMRVRDLDMLRHRAAVVENAVQVGAAHGSCRNPQDAQAARPCRCLLFLLPYLARQCEGKDRDRPVVSRTPATIYGDQGRGVRVVG